MNITIRLATPADVPDMAEILSRSFEVAYRDIVPLDYIQKRNTACRRAEYERNITDENTSYYVIQADEKNIGIMCIAPPSAKKIENDSGIDESFYELQVLYLHPNYYRMGIGSIAMNFALDKARAAGKSVMILCVLEENFNSIKFYEKCGFKADGAYKFMNYGKPIKCIRMRREL